MVVFKFGGASVRDAAGVINLAEIVKMHRDTPLLVVVSAMAKTTNALEKLARAFADRATDAEFLLDEIKHFHYAVLDELFGPGDPVYDEIANTFVEIEWTLEDEPHEDFDFLYDQIVSVGEILSSRIVAAFLRKAGVDAQWIDARGYIQTDNTYREANVDWNKSCLAVRQELPQRLEQQVLVTQGFIGGTSENFTTTLGREGSDYTAAIFGSCLGAESVTTWKDVPGILNADPKAFPDTVKFDRLSYNEAIEMTFYGASVIHPKTLKPLENAGIPLLVKSFLDPQAPGTVIGKEGTKVFEQPVIIQKTGQVLLSISARDFSFISEGHLSEIFRLFAEQQVKVNLMQTSALSFSVCIDFRPERFDKLLADLSAAFRTKYNQQVSLLTIRHYRLGALRQLVGEKTVLLEQVSRNTAQFVVTEAKLP